MAANRRGQRSPYSEALEWSTRITSLGCELAVPAALGYWLDTRWGTGPWLLVTGAVLGFLAFMTHLLQLAKQSAGPPKPSDRDRSSDIRDQTSEIRDQKSPPADQNTTPPSDLRPPTSDV